MAASPQASRPRVTANPGPDVPMFALGRRVRSVGGSGDSDPETAAVRVPRLASELNRRSVVPGSTRSGSTRSR
jgi:hypothetical protein